MRHRWQMCTSTIIRPVRTPVANAYAERWIAPCAASSSTAPSSGTAGTSNSFCVNTSSTTTRAAPTAASANTPPTITAASPIDPASRSDDPGLRRAHQRIPPSILNHRPTTATPAPTRLLRRARSRPEAAPTLPIVHRTCFRHVQVQMFELRLQRRREPQPLEATTVGRRPLRFVLRASRLCETPVGLLRRLDPFARSP